MVPSMGSPVETLVFPLPGELRGTWALLLVPPGLRQSLWWSLVTAANLSNYLKVVGLWSPGAKA